VKRKLARSATLSTPQKATISDDGVRVETAETSITVKWPLVDSVRLTKNLVLFLKKKQLLVAIPVRAFETTEQSEAFVTILKEQGIDMQYKKATSVTATHGEAAE
jgi:hypothetical protein